MTIADWLIVVGLVLGPLSAAVVYMVWRRRRMRSKRTELESDFEELPGYMYTRIGGSIGLRKPDFGVEVEHVVDMPSPPPIALRKDRREPH